MKRKRDEAEDYSPEEKRPKQGRKAYVPLVTGKWKKSAKQIAEWFEQEEKREEDRNQVIPHYLDSGATTESSAMYDIARRINILRTTFHKGFKPSPQQRALFDLMMTVNLRWIVGDRYEMYKPLLLNELQLGEIRADLHYIMSRQMGKTTVVAEGSATFAIHIAILLAIFSTGGRTSKALMKLIRGAVQRKLGDEASRIVRKNGSELRVRVIPLEPMDRVLFSDTIAYPASGASKFAFIVLQETTEEEEEEEANLSLIKFAVLDTSQIKYASMILPS